MLILVSLRVFKTPMVLPTWVLLTAVRQEIKKEKEKIKNFFTAIKIAIALLGSLFDYYLLGETISFRHYHNVIFSGSDSNFPTSILLPHGSFPSGGDLRTHSSVQSITE